MYLLIVHFGLYRYFLKADCACLPFGIEYITLIPTHMTLQDNIFYNVMVCLSQTL